MGSGASKKCTPVERVKTVYLSVSGEVVPIKFASSISTADLKDLIASAVGISRWSQQCMVDSHGALISIAPSMPTNSRDNPYHVQCSDMNPTDTQMFRDVLDKVGEEFSRAFKVTEFHSHVENRMCQLEKLVEKESTRTVELEKCQREVAEIKDFFCTHKSQIDAIHRERRVSDAISKSRKSHLPYYPKYVLTRETIEHLKTPTFDIWQWEPNEMLCLLEHMYQELGLLDHFQINPITFRKWLLQIQENYRNNPFHNFRHCFCVTQMMYGIIHLCGLQSRLSRTDLLELLTAAISHDLDHPGYNNAYQINARTELAIRYNDISPLENHHCAVAFQILADPETNILSNLNSDDYKTVRTGIINLILATDMARHSEILADFDRMVAGGFSFANSEHIKPLKMLLIKCCDISNEVRPMAVSEPWVDCLLEEYFMQSDREKSEGLPVAPFMDRDKVTKPSAQIGFIKFVLIPLFEATTKAVPEMSVMVKSLKDSLEYYEQLKMMEDMLKEGTTAQRQKKVSVLGKMTPTSTASSH